MPCSDIYLYNEIFTVCGAKIRTLLLDPTSIIVNPSNTINPYPLYEDRDLYDLDAALFKGIVVWTARKYYASLSDACMSTSDNTYSANAGFYVVPIFGNVSIRPNVEYKQLLVITFDSNSDLDYDPYGTKISKVISVFINNVYNTLEKYGNELEVDVGRMLYTRIVSISQPISVGTSPFERRAVTIELRYCHCY